MKQRSRHLLSVILQFLCRSKNALYTVALANFLQSSGSRIAGSNLRPQIALALLRRADIRENHLQHVALHCSAANKENRRNPQPFLINLARESH